MRGLIVAGLLLLCSGTASANPISDVGETVASTTVNGARWTGHTVGAGVTWLLVNTDSVLHWTNAVLHDKVIHPAVSLLTLGSVELSGS